MSLTCSILTFKMFVSTHIPTPSVLMNMACFFYQTPQSHTLSIYVFISACSANSISGSICGFVTLTTQVTTSLPTDGLRDIIGNGIGSVTKSQEFIDGLYNEVDSCNGTFSPTPEPTKAPVSIPTRSPTAVITYQFNFQIEYTISCVEEFLERQMAFILDELISDHESYVFDTNIQDVRKYTYSYSFCVDEYGMFLLPDASISHFINLCFHLSMFGQQY